MAQGDLAAPERVDREARRRRSTRRRLVAYVGHLLRAVLAADRRSAARCCSGSRRPSSTTTGQPGGSRSARTYACQGDGRGPAPTPIRPGSALSSSCGAPERRAGPSCSWRRAGLSRPQGRGDPRGRAGVALLPIVARTRSAALHQHQLAGSTSWWASRRRRWTGSSAARMPYYLSPGWLRIDPTFDPLRKQSAVPEAGGEG